MPMAMATCWLSATARMAMPLRDQRKNHPKAAMKKMLTDAPRSWMGGMNKGPITKGSSLMGRGKGFVPAPKKVGPTPRRTEASPMVAMTTAMMGRPISLRSTTRSRANPNTIMLPSPRITATHRGPPRADGQGHHQARDHHELALREIHRVGRLVDEHESQGDQGIHQADEHTVREEEEEEAELFRHGRALPPRPQCGPATGSRPGVHPRR